MDAQENLLLWEKIGKVLESNPKSTNYNGLALLYLLSSGFTVEELEAGPDKITDERLKELGYKRLQK